MVAPSGGADETIVTRFVADTSQALSEAAKWRAQVDILKKQLQELANQSGQSFKDIAEGMRRAGPDLTGITNKQALEGMDTKKWGKALSAALSEAEKAAKGLDQEMKQKPKDVGAASKAFSNLGDVGKWVFGTIFGITAVTALRNFISAMGDAIESGYELSRSIYRAAVAIQSLQFRGLNASAQQTVEWVKELRKEFGTLSEREALDVVSTTQLLTRNLGFTEEQIKNVIKISTALAVVQGKDVAESARQLVLFFSSGYGEGLQKAGIAVNRFTVAQEAMRMGFGKSYMALTEHQRALAAYTLVMRQAGDIIKLAGQYQETAAGQMDMLTKEIDTQQSLIGTKLLPLKKAWLDIELQFINAYTKLIQASAATESERLRVDIERAEQRKQELESLGQSTQELDAYIAGLKERLEEVQAVADSFTAGDKVAEELEKATEASEKAASELADFRQQIEAGYILRFATDESKKEIDDLQKQIDALTDQNQIITFDADIVSAEDKLDELKRQETELTQVQAEGREKISSLMDQLAHKQERLIALQQMAQTNPAIYRAEEYQTILGQIDQLQKELDALRLKQVDIPIKLNTIEANRQVIELQKQLAELTHLTVLSFDEAEAIQMLDEIEKRLMKIQERIEVLKQMEVLPDALRDELAELEQEGNQLGQVFTQLENEFGLTIPENISESIETVKKLQGELQALQEYRETMIELGLDTTALDAEISAKVREIEAIKVRLAVQLNIDVSQVDQLLAVLAFDVERITQEIVNEWEDYTEEVVQINQKMEEDIAKIYSDLAEDIADVQRDMQQALQDANRKYHQEELKAEREFQEQMRRLREGFLFDLEDALRERDAVQIMRLYRQYSLDVNQAKRRYEMEKDERRRAYREELADIRRQAAQRIAELKREAAQEVALRQQQAAEEAENAKVAYQEWLQERLDELAYQLMTEFGMEEDQVKKILTLLGEYFGKGGKSSVTWDEYRKIVEKAMQSGIDKLKEYLALEKEILAVVKEIAAVQAATPAPAAPYEHAAGGYAGYGMSMLGERGYEFVLNHPTTAAMENALGGRLTQANILSAAGGTNGRMTLEVWLAPGLEAEIVDKALDGVASTFDTVIRRR